MTWAEKLREKIDPKLTMFDKNILYVDDFDSAVLEKNREIAKELLKLSVSNTPSWLHIRKDLEARAFREQVAEAEKREKAKQ